MLRRTTKLLMIIVEDQMGINAPKPTRLKTPASIPTSTFPLGPLLLSIPPPPL
jgi:hypothetical protein